jgi:ABC-type lipoprotein export system ATPase subunit
MGIFGRKNGNGKTAVGGNGSNHDAVIKMRNIVKTYHTPVGEFHALKSIDADFHGGEFVGVVGKSGSGKSTLVNMITGIDRPTSGSVEIEGTLIHTLTESQMARWRGHNLGIVFQFFQLLPMLSLLENVMLPMDLSNKYPHAEREKRAIMLLKMVGLEKYAHKMPAAVSGGQQQTAAIARALANDPPLLLADEPTGNLDSRTASKVFDIFQQLAGAGKTIVMVTHDPVLAQKTSRILLLSDGEVINEAIVTALPMLSHPQMLKATHKLTPKTYRPGETIIRQGVPNDALYIITKGAVQISVAGKRGEENTVNYLNRGDYFGEIELLQNRSAIASVKVSGDEPLETVVLERSVFLNLVDDVSALREEVTNVSQARIAENQASLKKMPKGMLNVQTALA